MSVKIEIKDGYYYYPGPNGERLRKKVELISSTMATEEQKKRFYNSKTKIKIFTETHPEAKLDDEDYD